ncbi:hypothetical protein S7S_16135 [Isoalcanivorax pacificus W11-5]|uniref:DUF4190 domain-containing protein n=1 Tax=Isoalcanivorax pacificus W11-5 TaxID=391936 RepID=A0A0B4XMN7_9GAMM|nr:hypothetical protein [Isoalcanivorax pacificus]AJD49639.1 hypothetical protein S7S_16135 [Isoalcanivorax pacificus W11-5]
MVDLLTLLPALISATLITFASSILCLRFYPTAPRASLWVVVFTVLLILQCYGTWFGLPLLINRYGDDNLQRSLMLMNALGQFGELLLIGCLLTAAFIDRTARQQDVTPCGRGPMMLIQGLLSLLLLPPLGIVVSVFAAWSLTGKHTLDRQDHALTRAGLILGVLALLLLLGTAAFLFWYVIALAGMGNMR